MRGLEMITNQITLMTNKSMSSAALHALVAQQCRSLRDSAISSGSASPVFRTYVDGKLGVPEEAASLNGGMVVYKFSSLAQAANWALTECQKRSPVSSGNFRKSWALLVNGKVWPALDDIPQGAEVWIVNTTPYSRKIEVGGMKIRVPPGIVEAVRQSVQRKFPAVAVIRAFKPLAGGRDARGNPVPYILKGAGIASGISYDKKAKSWNRKHPAYKSNRSDRQAGEQLLYPTLILTEKGF